MTEMITCLRDMVAAFHVAALSAREAHWNVRGIHFGPLHSLFGDAYDELAGIEDVIAERIRALGATVPATMTTFTQTAGYLPESVVKKTSGAMVEEVLACYRRLSTCLCKAITEYEKTDPVTTNILQDICAKLDKRAWMLRMLTIKEK